MSHTPVILKEARYQMLETIKSKFRRAHLSACRCNDCIINELTKLQVQLQSLKSEWEAYKRAVQRENDRTRRARSIGL